MSEKIEKLADAYGKQICSTPQSAAARGQVSTAQYHYRAGIRDGLQLAEEAVRRRFVEMIGDRPRNGMEVMDVESALSVSVEAIRELRGSK